MAPVGERESPKAGGTLRSNFAQCSIRIFATIAGLWCTYRSTFCIVAHLSLVPGFCLQPALVGDVLILSFNLSNDAVQVQVSVVVHLKDHRSVRDLRLQLAQLLKNEADNVHQLFLKYRTFQPSSPSAGNWVFLFRVYFICSPFFLQTAKS